MKKYDNHIERLREPALRAYTITTAASLAVIFVVLFDSGSVAAAGVPVVCGIAGLLLRWTAMPIVLVLTVAYFMIFPLGIPFGNPFREEATAQTRIFDFILIAAILMYLIAQFRLFSLTPAQGLVQAVRPVSTLAANELHHAGVLTAVMVGIGQFIWWFLDEYELHFGHDGPIRTIPPGSLRLEQRVLPSTQSLGLSRFLLLTTLTVMVAAISRMAFWYLRLRQLNPQEARLLLTDTLWKANRRELARQETWRSHALGHDVSRRGVSRSTFRWIVRGIVILNAIGFLAWILYIYFSYR